MLYLCQSIKIKSKACYPIFTRRFLINFFKMCPAYKFFMFCHIQAFDVSPHIYKYITHFMCDCDKIQRRDNCRGSSALDFQVDDLSLTLLYRRVWKRNREVAEVQKINWSVYWHWIITLPLGVILFWCRRSECRYNWITIREMQLQIYFFFFKVVEIDLLYFFES